MMGVHQHTGLCMWVLSVPIQGLMLVQQVLYTLTHPQPFSLSFDFVVVLTREMGSHQTANSYKEHVDTQ